MKQDDINLSKIYGSIKISDNKPLQLQENILQSARKWFDRMSNVPNQNVDDVVYSALKKAAQEIEKAGFDSSKILTADSIKTFKDLIQKNDKPELPKEVESTTGITPQEQPTEIPSFNSQQESEDNLKFAPKPEITPSTPSTQSTQPQTKSQSTPARTETSKRKKMIPYTSWKKQYEVKPGMMTISKFKELQQMSDDEFNYLRRNYLVGIKPPLIPIDYLDDPEIQQILGSKEESKKTPVSTSTTTKKPATTKKPSKTSAVMQKATPKSKK